MEFTASPRVCNSYFLRQENHIALLVNPYRHVHPSHSPLTLTAASVAQTLTPSTKISSLNPFLARGSSLDSFGSDTDRSSSGPQFAIILEVEGVLLDVPPSGNRMAFNAAFKKLGLDCAYWSKPVYTDLVSMAAADEERMIHLFFNRTGWPTSLMTSEREAFVQKVLEGKKSALEELVISNDLPLRRGVEKFIDDAITEGIPVAVLTSSCNLGEKLARMSKIKMIGKLEVDNSLYGQIASGLLHPTVADHKISAEAIKAGSPPFWITFLLKVATVHAAAECVGVSVQNSILVAGTQSTIAAAERVGMPYVVLCNSLTPRSGFPSAKAVMDGFGDVDLTVSKLRSKLQP